MRLTCKPAATNVYIAQDVNARGAKDGVFTVDMWYNAKSVASVSSTFRPKIGMSLRTDSGNRPFLLD